MAYAISFPQTDREAVKSFFGCLFRHAKGETFINLRAFHDLKDDAPPLFIEAVKIGASNCIDRICARIHDAAKNAEPHVFCPTVCTFKEANGAAVENLAEGVALSVECDSEPYAALKRLREILGPPTVIVASGGVWKNLQTGELEHKLHLHWRLAVPTRDAADHERLREARALAAEIVGADKTGTAIVHPLRWPGPWHRKNPRSPRIARLKASPDSEIELGEALQRLRDSSPPKAHSPNGHDRDENGHDLRASLAELEDALSVAPNPNVHWDEWNRIGMAMWVASDGRGFNAFDAWSRKSSKYDADNTKARWEHYASSPPSRIGAGSIFFLADQAAPNWRNKVETRKPTRDPGASAEREAPPSEWQRGAFTAIDLQTMDFPPFAWIVQNILPAEGAALLCSRPKFGKSWLALDLCLGCTSDRFILGTLKPKEGDTLYLALEDSKRRLQRRMAKLLPFGSKWPQRLTLTTEWRRLHEGGLDDIRAWYDHTKGKGGNPILVAVDVLAKVRKPTGRAPQYEADYEALTGITKLANELGIAILVVHHIRKMQADDLMEMVSGTFGVTGAVDTILVMANKPNGTVLDIRGRDAEQAELAIEFEKSTCRWRVLGEAAEIHRSEQQTKILAALRQADGPLTASEIENLTEIKHDSLSKALFRLAAEGAIKRVGRGQNGQNGQAPKHFARFGQQT